MTTVSVTTARDNLYDLIEEVARSGKSIGITNKGETKAVLVNPDELASWEATLDVMSDPNLVKSIKESEKDIKSGRYVTWDELKKELSLDASDKIHKARRKGLKKT